MAICMEKVVQRVNVLFVALLNLLGAFLTWAGKLVEMYAPTRILVEYWYPLCLPLGRFIPNMKMYLTPTYMIGVIIVLVTDGYLIWNTAKAALIRTGS